MVGFDGCLDVVGCVLTSQLKGHVFVCNGDKWLKVIEYQQSGREEFTNVEDESKWMGFDGGPSNGGKWLHSP